MYLPIPIGIIPIELIERVKFIKAPLRLNPCRLGKAYESDKSRHPEKRKLLLMNTPGIIKYLEKKIPILEKSNR